MKITAHQFFKMGEIPADCELSGAELQAVLWKYQELQQGFERQQIFWKTSSGAIGAAYKKLATVQDALQTSQEQLREANERLEEKVSERTTALDEARELAESIIASISDSLVIVDPQGIIQKTNRSTQALLEYEEAEIVGQPLSSMMIFDHADEREHTLRPDWCEALLRDALIKNHQVGYRTKSNRVVPIVFSAAKVKNARDELLGIVCVAKDISEQRQKERELHAQLERIREQQETIRTLFSPIIQLWPQVLALPIVGMLDQERATETTEQLLQAVVDSRSSFVIIDVTGVKTMDTVATAQLLKMHRATRLLGADCLISGMSPAVAQMIVHNGSDLKDLASFRTLEAALRHAFLRLGQANTGSNKGQDKGLLPKP